MKPTIVIGSPTISKLIQGDEVELEQAHIIPASGCPDIQGAMKFMDCLAGCEPEDHVSKDHEEAHEFFRSLYTTPPPKEEPKAGWAVPFKDAFFGEFAEHGLDGSGIVSVFYNEGRGLKSCPGSLGFVRLPHQIYKKDLEELLELIEGIQEIVVVHLNYGSWRTLWADSPKNVSYPESRTSS